MRTVTVSMARRTFAVRNAGVVQERVRASGSAGGCLRSPRLWTGGSGRMGRRRWGRVRPSPPRWTAPPKSTAVGGSGRVGRRRWSTGGAACVRVHRGGLHLRSPRLWTGGPGRVGRRGWSTGGAGCVRVHRAVDCAAYLEPTSTKILENRTFRIRQSRKSCQRRSAASNISRR
jgi:hypothetical protein